MKNKTIIGACVICMSFFAACAGNHASNNGQDTQANTYGFRDTAKMDTATVHGPDNSGSGGTGTLKDVTRQVIVKTDSTKKDSIKK